MRTLLRRIAHALQNRRHERELAEEIAFHREMKQQELEAGGVPARDAAIQAPRALGNDALAVNRARDIWIWPWLQDLSQDVRFACRLLVMSDRVISRRCGSDWLAAAASPRRMAAPARTRSSSISALRRCTFPTPIRSASGSA